MRIFKTKGVSRFTRRARIADAHLVEAIDRAERGLIDADLGGGLIKQRVARSGEGKRGGYRMLIGYRSGARAVFLFGYAKSDLDNIKDDQLALLRAAGQEIIAARTADLERQLALGTIVEVTNG